MSDTIQYVTEEGERWDTISYKAYGTPNEVKRILDANPAVPYSVRVPGGLVIELPVLAEYQVGVPVALLPPWKR